MIHDRSPPHSSFLSTAEDSPSALCQHCTSPSPLCTTGFGESPGACVGLALGPAIYGAFWDRNCPPHPKSVSAAGSLLLAAGFSLQQQGK